MKARPDTTHELALFSEGYSFIAGVDEAGRGALAGPVVAAAVVLPLERFDLTSILSNVRDSKQLDAAARERCNERIRAVAVTVGMGEASAREVDELGLLPATRAAMRRAVEALSPPPSYLLIDHILVPELEDIGQRPITRGDQSVLSIAAASVIAKVWRDRLMGELSGQFASYGFERHKGYGTAQHREALARLGPCPEHRRSYAPVQLAMDA